MTVVDYYEILEISPSASQTEIKSAYRKLAQIHHPDKNKGSRYASARFELIKEAYETLSDPVRKEKYVQERWLAKAWNHSRYISCQTPVEILNHVLNTGEKIYRMDIYRMDTEGIRNELLSIINTENIQLLNSFNETSVNDAIVEDLLQTITLLPPADAFFILKKMAHINHSQPGIIKRREEELSVKIFWVTWKPAFIISLVVLFCILIWATSLKK